MRHAPTVKILLVEDDERLSSFISRGLAEEGHSVVVRDNGYDAEDQMLLDEYDVVILDLMLPGQSGMETLRHVRDSAVTTPVLILTARDGLEDKVRGLDGGADDYLTKPFEFDELLARLRALDRRIRGAASGPIQVGPLVIDQAKRQAWCEGSEVPLTHLEFSLLLYLAEHAGEVLSRARIEQYVWGDDFERGSNVVAVYIRYIRQKLERHHCAEMIETVRGSGYRLKMMA